MSTDFKEKRINYLNNWPNVEPFDIEKRYYGLVNEIKKKRGTIFVPFQLKKNNDISYNKTISFMIEAVDQIEKYPNFSYEFIFKAYDCFMSLFHPSIVQITDKNKMLCDNEWKNILRSHSILKGAFEELIATIPVKACQYLYIRLTERTPDNKAYQRVTTDVSGGSSVDSIKRKNFIDDIENKYGVDYNNYADSIRKGVCEEKSVIKIFYDNDWGWKLVSELSALALYITALSGHVKSRRKNPPVLLELYGLFR